MKFNIWCDQCERWFMVGLDNLSDTEVTNLTLDTKNADQLGNEIFQFCKNNKDFPYDLANNTDELGIDEYKPYGIFALEILKKYCNIKLGKEEEDKK